MSTIVSILRAWISVQSSIAPDTNSVASSLIATISTSGLSFDRPRDPVEKRVRVGRQLVELLVQMRDLELGLQVHFVLDVAPDVVLRRLAVLAQEHEHRQHDRLQR